MQDSAFHAWHEFNHTRISNVLNEAVDDFVSELAVCHLAAAEPQARLNLVAFIEETDCLVLFGLVVVLIDGDGEFDLFNGDDLLFLASSAITLFFFVQVSSVVLNAADRGNGIGRHFDEIEAALAGNFQGFKGCQDAKLFAIFVDDANLSRANTVIDADKGLGRTFVECDGTPPRFPAAEN